jgi:hypothetical protein
MRALSGADIAVWDLKEGRRTAVWRLPGRHRERIPVSMAGESTPGRHPRDARSRDRQLRRRGLSVDQDRGGRSPTTPRGCASGRGDRSRSLPPTTPIGRRISRTSCPPCSADRVRCRIHRGPFPSELPHLAAVLRADGISLALGEDVVGRYACGTSLRRSRPNTCASMRPRRAGSARQSRSMPSRRPRASPCCHLPGSTSSLWRCRRCRRGDRSAPEIDSCGKPRTRCDPKVMSLPRPDRARGRADHAAMTRFAVGQESWRSRAMTMTRSARRSTISTSRPSRARP